MEWCWHCFADGMNFYFDKNWILSFPQIATNSYNWITFLNENENNYVYENNILKIKKPDNIIWDDAMINGFRFLIEDYIKSNVEIINYFIKDGFLLIHFKPKK
jgi:hypothetical protein